MKQVAVCMLTFGVTILMSLLPLTTHATVVEVRTVMGNFQVNLFDEDTPQTVSNFLDYVNSGAYSNLSLIHI